jgi:hypothetical protein
VTVEEAAASAASSEVAKTMGRTPAFVIGKMPAVAEAVLERQSKDYTTGPKPCNSYILKLSVQLYPSPYFLNNPDRRRESGPVLMRFAFCSDGCHAAMHHRR